MTLRTCIMVLVLLVSTRANAMSCPDHHRQERDVLEILDYKTTAALPIAMKRLADTWFCIHPTASASEFVNWISTMPSDHARSRRVIARSLDTNRVLVLYARTDAPDGGEAALYVRHDGRWSLHDTVVLEWTPELVAQLGDGHFVIREENRIPRVTTGNVRILRVDGTRFSQPLFEREINNSTIVSNSDRHTTITFERSSKDFSLDESLRFRFELHVVIDGTSISSSITSTTPALEALQASCGKSPFLPACHQMRVLAMRTRGQRTMLDIEAPVVCVNPAGSAPLGKAVITLERADSTYRVVGLASTGCKRVRPRRPNEAF
jgi:hypothetical protein